ncbi:MAG: DUF2461 domain-containing protein [Bacteroidota bacterium]
MSKQKIFDFLRDLSANNSKDWMDVNRKRYHEAKDIWLSEIELILRRLVTHDPDFEQMRAKDTLMRITNNRRFHPDKPLYRDHFACSPNTDLQTPGFYIHISPSGSFIGGGIYRPPSPVLQKIREGIDYDGEKFKQILRSAPFTDMYSDLDRDEHMLKTAPRGFAKDHIHVDLLRRKSFTAITPLTEAQVVSDDFPAFAERAYLSLKPFCDYLTQAVKFEA